MNDASLRACVLSKNGCTFKVNKRFWKASVGANSINIIFRSEFLVPTSNLQFTIVFTLWYFQERNEWCETRRKLQGLIDTTMIGQRV